MYRKIQGEKKRILLGHPTTTEFIIEMDILSTFSSFFYLNFIKHKIYSRIINISASFLFYFSIEMTVRIHSVIYFP
jgi:hypothetical protein